MAKAPERGTAAVEATVRYVEPGPVAIQQATDLGNVQVLKHENVYLLTDQFGDIHPDSRGLGLYLSDTRILSCSVLRIAGIRPVLLQGSMGGNFRGTIHLTNPSIDRNIANKTGKADPLAKKLIGIADRLEALRKTLVATREGGQIAGEEQLREKLGNLYGSVNAYEGRPTASQLAAVEAIEVKIADAQSQIDAIVGKELPALNAGLAKLGPVTAMTREEWVKKQPK